MKKFLSVIALSQLLICSSSAGEILPSAKAAQTQTKSTAKETDAGKSASLLLDVNNLQASFSIELQKAVIVTWEVNSRSKDLTYIIERGTNNIFTQIGTVKSANTLNLTDFYFTDFSPRSGTAYYRIKIAGTKDEVKYSKSVSVTSKTANLAAETASEENLLVNSAK